MTRPRTKTDPHPTSGWEYYMVDHKPIQEFSFKQKVGVLVNEILDHIGHLLAPCRTLYIVKKSMVHSLHQI
jgi:hypothetical protein